MTEEERLTKVADYARDAFATAGGATKAIAMLADAMIAVLVLGFDPDVAERALPDFAQYVIDQGTHVLAQRHHGTTVQ